MSLHYRTIQMERFAVEVVGRFPLWKLGTHFSWTSLGFHFHHGLITFMTNPFDIQRAMEPPHTVEVR